MRSQAKLLNKDKGSGSAPVPSSLSQLDLATLAAGPPVALQISAPPPDDPLHASSITSRPTAHINSSTSGTFLATEGSMVMQHEPASPGSPQAASITGKPSSTTQQRAKKAKSHHGGNFKKGATNADLFAPHAKRIPLTAQPFFRLRVVSRQLIFVAKMFRHMRHIRMRRHFEKFVRPRAAFIIQCCYRRHMLRNRMKNFNQLMVLRVSFLPRVMRRILRSRNAKALMCRVASGFVDRKRLHILLKDRQIERSTRLVQRFVRCKVAVKIRQVLELESEERRSVMDSYVNATVGIFRSERQSLMLLQREANRLATMWRASNKSEAADACLSPAGPLATTGRKDDGGISRRRESLALAIEVFSSDLSSKNASTGEYKAVTTGGSDAVPASRGGAVAELTAAALLDTSAVEHLSDLSSASPQQPLGHDSDSETTATGTASPPMQQGQGGSFWGNRSTSDQLSCVLASYDHDTVTRFVREYISPTTGGSFSFAPPSSPTFLARENSSFNIFRLVTKPSSNSFIGTSSLPTAARNQLNPPLAMSGLLGASSSQQQLNHSSGSFVSYGSLMSGMTNGSEPVHTVVPSSISASPHVFDIPQVAEQNHGSSFGTKKSKRKMSYRFRPLTDVQKAFVALLAQTESLERKELIREYFDEAHVISQHMEWYFAILGARGQIHSLLLPLLPQLEPLWILRKGLALLKSEGEGRQRIEAEYAAMPLHFLNRPMIDKKAEYRREQIRAKLMRESSFAKMTRRSSEQLIPALRQSLSMENRRRVSSISMVPRPPDVARKSTFFGSGNGEEMLESITSTLNYFARKQHQQQQQQQSMTVPQASLKAGGGMLDPSLLMSFTAIPATTSMDGDAFTPLKKGEAASISITYDGSGTVQRSGLRGQGGGGGGVPQQLHSEHDFGPVLTGSPGDVTLRVSSAHNSRAGSFFCGDLLDHPAGGSRSSLLGGDGVSDVSAPGRAPAPLLPTTLLQPRSSSGSVIPADFYGARPPSISMPALGGRKMSLAEANAMFPSKRQQQQQQQVTSVTVPVPRRSSLGLLSFASNYSSATGGDDDDDAADKAVDVPWHRRSTLSNKDYEHRKRNSVVDISTLRASGSLLPRPSTSVNSSVSCDSINPGLSIAIPEFVDHSEWKFEVPKSEACGADLCKGRY